MAFKLRSGNKTNFKNMGSSPIKQKGEVVVIDGKTYPKGYTKKDVKFLKEQREDVVRYEDLDAKGRAIWKKQGKPVPGSKEAAKKLIERSKKKKSPAKQIDPLDYGLLDEAIEFDKEYKAKKADKANKDFLKKSKKEAGQRVKNEGFRRDLGKHHHKHTTGSEATRPPKAAIVKSNKKAHEKLHKEHGQTKVNKRQTADTARKMDRAKFKRYKKTAKKLLNVSDETAARVGRAYKAFKNTPKQLAKGGKQILKTGSKVLRGAGPIGAAVTGVSMAYPHIKNTAKATVKGLKERAKKEHETGFKNPGVRKL